MSTDERGLSLIELLVFIVVVGIAVTGVLSVFSLNARTSADPVVQKQALAIADSLLEEVLAKPYTYCDTDDANVETASSTAGCATMAETAMAPEAGETRYSNLTPYDNVNDYNGFAMTGIVDPSGNAVPDLNGYTASVQVQTPPVPLTNIPAGETLFVTVTVTGPGNHSVTLSGYRTRYAPNL
jgi:MSHA pilin protein MshD